MKVKLKICDGECGKETIIWKQFEGKRYCRNCWSKIKPTSPILRGSAPLKQRTSIAKRSDKRAEEEKEYSRERKIFLLENPKCKMNIIGLCVHTANTVQHLKGRIGKLLLDKKWWMPACWPCHQYADTHPEEALKNGWSELRLAK